jgi:hypothetical protein
MPAEAAISRVVAPSTPLHPIATWPPRRRKRRRCLHDVLPTSCSTSRSCSTDESVATVRRCRRPAALFSHGLLWSTPAEPSCPTAR